MLASTSRMSALWSRCRFDRTLATRLVEQHTRYLSTEVNSDLSDCLQNTFGVDPKLHKGIVKALESAFGKDLQVTHLESFGQEGLDALAESVKHEQSKIHGRRKRPSTKLQINIPHHGTSFSLKWRLGESLLNLAQANDDVLGEYMMGTCGGNMSCCTCHVYIDQPEFMEFLDAPNKSELDMLDMAYDPTDSSRLGCQVRLTKEMLESNTKFEVRIPEGINNMWD